MEADLEERLKELEEAKQRQVRITIIIIVIVIIIISSSRRPSNGR